MTTKYDTTEASRIDQLSPEQQTADKTVDFDVPDNATYGPHDITEISYCPFGLFVVCEGASFADGWDQLQFQVSVDDDGVISVERTPVGLVPPESAKDSDTPGGNESEELYDLLESLGVGVF